MTVSRCRSSLNISFVRCDDGDDDDGVFDMRVRDFLMGLFINWICVCLVDFLK